MHVLGAVSLTRTCAAEATLCVARFFVLRELWLVAIAQLLANLIICCVAYLFCSVAIELKQGRPVLQRQALRHPSCCAFVLCLALLTTASSALVAGLGVYVGVLLLTTAAALLSIGERMSCRHPIWMVSAGLALVMVVVIAAAGAVTIRHMRSMRVSQEYSAARSRSMRMVSDSQAVLLAALLMRWRSARQIVAAYAIAASLELVYALVIHLSTDSTTECVEWLPSQLSLLNFFVVTLSSAAFLYLPVWAIMMLFEVRAAGDARPPRMVRALTQAVNSCVAAERAPQPPTHQNIEQRACMGDATRGVGFAGRCAWNAAAQRVGAAGQRGQRRSSVGHHERTIASSRGCQRHCVMARPPPPQRMCVCNELCIVKTVVRAAQ